MNGDTKNDLPPGLVDRVEKEVRERLTTWIKHRVKRWQAVVLGVGYVLSVLGAAGLTWKIFEASVAARYESLATKVTGKLEGLQKLEGQLVAMIDRAAGVDAQVSTATQAIQAARTEAEAAIRILKNEATDAATGLVNREIKPLATRVAELEGTGRAQQEAVAAEARARGTEVATLREDLQGLRQEVRKTEKAVNPFQAVDDVRELEELIKLDPWDIKINALRALGHHYAKARSSFGEVVDLAKDSNNAEIRREAWATAEAVFHPDDPVLRHCVATLTKGNQSTFERMEQLLRQKLDTDDKKRAIVEPFARHMRATGADPEGLGRLVLVMQALFTASDTESLQKLRASFRDVFGESMQLLLAHSDGNVQNRTVALAQLIGPTATWAGALTRALDDRRSFPFALQIIGRMSPVPPTLLDAIASKLDANPTHRAEAERILAEHGR